MKLKREELPALFATSEWRELDAHQKSAKLVIEHEMSLREAGDAVGLSKGAVERAVKAVRDHRDPGVNGHPPSLNHDETKQLVDMIVVEVGSSHPPNYQDAARMVTNDFFTVFSPINLLLCDSKLRRFILRIVPMPSL